MGNMTDEYFDPDWKMLDTISKLKKEWEDSAPIHLYAWLEVSYPDVFKQWQSIYDIEREI